MVTNKDLFQRAMTCVQKRTCFDIDGRVEYAKENSNWVMYNEKLRVLLTLYCIVFCSFM